MDDFRRKETTELTSVQEFRTHSIIDYPSPCFGTKCRNLFLCVAISITFFIIPILIIVLGVTTLLNKSTTEEIDEASTEENSNTLRMLDTVSKALTLSKQK